MLDELSNSRELFCLFPSFSFDFCQTALDHVLIYFNALFHDQCLLSNHPSRVAACCYQ